MNRQDDRSAAYLEWLFDIEWGHPDCAIVPTPTGCAVYKILTDELVTEYDYEPDPHEAARVRH